ncbi:polyadenylate-binding protein [Stylonychia lemnae]|uniref:Polyadenylate-binding protein n=1 Tax=Stylonychia lemnae TaxID=5949 RepID=A0A078B3S7_STYLE|nr:polyadenylate-binding protein [Stylonychia lemnae]|eukprot:CDW89195.1 polyadenylate-binding protein [Stylonychia lemnae]
MIDLLDCKDAVLMAKVSRDQHLKSRGYGYVTFKNSELALNATQLTKSKQTSWQIAQQWPVIRECKKTGYGIVNVMNFPQLWNEDCIQKIFQSFRKISMTKINRELNGASTLFAVIQYQDPRNDGIQCALRSVKGLNDFEMEEHTLNVKVPSEFLAEYQTKALEILQQFNKKDSDYKQNVNKFILYYIKQLVGEKYASEIINRFSTMLINQLLDENLQNILDLSNLADRV